MLRILCVLAFVALFSVARLLLFCAVLGESDATTDLDSSSEQSTARVHR